MNTQGVGTITELLEKIDQITQSFTFNGYAALVQSLTPAIALAITAYIALLGWFSLQGWSEMTVSQAAKHSLKIAIVFSFATQWDVFSTFIYQVFTNGPNEISVVLMQATGHSGDSVNSSLQQAFDAGMQVVEQLWNLSGLSLKLMAAVLWILNILVSGIALFELAAAKFGLSITLVLAPVFVVFLLWDATKGIFESWLRFALGFALVPLFLSSVLLVINQLMQLCATQAQAALQSSSANLTMLTPFVLSGITSIGLLLKAAQIASGVAGGMSISALHLATNLSSMASHYSGLSGLKQAIGRNLTSAFSSFMGMDKKSQQEKALAKFNKMRNY